MTAELKIGHVSHYFGKIHVAAIELTDGDLDIGDIVHIKGHTSDFTQTIDSMQVEHAEIRHAGPGTSVGVHVDDHARVGDLVYRIEA